MSYNYVLLDLWIEANDPEESEHLTDVLCYTLSKLDITTDDWADAVTDMTEALKSMIYSSSRVREAMEVMNEYI